MSEPIIVKANGFEVSEYIGGTKLEIILRDQSTAINKFPLVMEVRMRYMDGTQLMRLVSWQAREVGRRLLAMADEMEQRD